MPTALRTETANPIADLIHELETARTLPRAALSAAVEHAVEIEPAIIALVEQAANGTLLIPKQANLLFFGLHALAAARRTGVYRPLMRMLRKLPEDDCEWLFGDATTETFAPIILAVFDGDTAPLIDAVMDRSADRYTRWTGWGVLARLTFDGAIERSAMVALLDRFERESLAEPNDPSWKGWQEAIILLGLEELRERMHATWADGRNPERKVDREANDEALSAARAAAPGDAARFIEQFLAPLGDPVEALAWFEKVDDTERNKTDTVDLRQDLGAACIGLDTEETEWLGRFFARRYGNGDEIWEAIDGFYSAQIVGPPPAPPQENILRALDFADGGPKFDNAEQAEYVTNLLTRYWNTIAYRLNAGQLHRPWLADGHFPVGALWSLSFLRAVLLRTHDWKRCSEEELVALTIESLMLLAGRGERASTLNRRTRDEFVAALPLMLASLHNICHGRRDPLARPPLPAELRRKIGRNDSCPCGSGKKYKRCCGSSDRRADH
jgi:yecA family protein